MNSSGPPSAPPADSADMTRITEEYCADEEGPLISADALSSAMKRDFQKLPTWHTALLSLVHVAFVVLSVILSVTCVIAMGNVEDCTKLLRSMKGDSVIAFGKVGMWMMVQLHTVYSQQHHRRARRCGYLQFYRQTKPLKHLPITVHSAGTALFLGVQAAGLTTPVGAYMIISILVVELFLVVPFLIYHIVVVWRHNTQRPAPDVCEEEQSYRIRSVPTETGFREGCSLEEVVDKQSDLIEYLKEHNRLLSKRLLNLTAQH